MADEANETRGQRQYRRLRERMAADPEYRERKLALARAALARYRSRHHERLLRDQRERDRNRYWTRRDEILARRRQEYVGAKANRIRETNRRSYARHRDKFHARRKAWRAEHLEDVRARERVRGRQRYAENPRRVLDYMKAWRQANPVRARAYVRISGHRRRKAAVGFFSVEEWFDLLERYEGKCAYCGSTEGIEADHRIPLSRGGPNTIDNILPACRSCNRRKFRRTEHEFRDLLVQERDDHGGVVGGGSGP